LSDQWHYSGVVANELGLTAEHFKNSPSIDIKFLTICFNTILKDKQIPDIFKTGIVTPVLQNERKHYDGYCKVQGIQIHCPCP
jgi:V8-like Glu-specific endopeptidase